MKPDTAHARLTESIAWIQQNLAPLELKFGPRRYLVIACHDLAIEHMASIDILYRSGLIGSMLALIRSLFESVVRGMWLDRCASELQLEQFRSHKLDKQFGEMVREIEDTFTSSNKHLSSIKSKTWKALNGYTHTGYNQISGRHGEGTLEATYKEGEIVSALQISAVFGLLAAGHLADAAEKPDLVAEVARKIRALDEAA